MTYFSENLAVFEEIQAHFDVTTISVRLWHKTCGEPRTYVSGAFERDICENRKFVCKNNAPKNGSYRICTTHIE